MVTQAINIIFDGPPGPEAGRFVEVETDDGKSIKIGEWEERPDGMWALRIDAAEQKCYAEAKLRELVEAAEERDRIENLEEPDYFPDPEKRYIFQDTKYQVWERYQAALTTAKEV